MATQQPHIVLKVHGEVDLDFALIPVTEALVEVIVERVDGLRTLGDSNFVRAEFWNGAAVFFETPFLDETPVDRDLGELLDQVTDEGYRVVTDRPDVHWRYFKRTDFIRMVVQRDRAGWNVGWRAWRESVELHTTSMPVVFIAALSNPYLKPEREPFAALADGTPLYPAHDSRLYPGEAYRRALSRWNGSTGEWVGVTLDGRLFRQSQLWGGDSPRPDEWQQFRLGGA